MAAWQKEWQAEALPPFINVFQITQHLFKKKVATDVRSVARFL